MTSSCTSSSSWNFFPARCFFRWRNRWIHNVAINSNNLFVNFRWTFNFCVEKSYDGTHLAFGGTLDRRCHFRHVSLKQSRFYHCQTSTAHRYRIKVDGSVATISIKNFPIGLHVMYLYFPDTPRIFRPHRRMPGTNLTHRNLRIPIVTLNCLLSIWLSRLSRHL